MIEERPTPDRMTEEERDKLISDLALKLRMSTDRGFGNGAAATRSWYDRYAGTINVVLGALLAFSLTLVGVIYKSSTDRLDRIERAANDATRELEALQKDRSARNASGDQWRESTEKELQGYRIGLSDFRQMQGTVREHAEALRRGRDERLADKDKIVDALAQLRTEVALLRQSMESRRRSEGESQMWNGLLSPHPIVRASLPRSPP